MGKKRQARRQQGNLLLADPSRVQATFLEDFEWLLWELIGCSRHLPNESPDFTNDALMELRRQVVMGTGR